MADFAPPAGPPPPKAPEVPAGWAVRWNDQYKEWFYVNVYTKQSQWEKPTAPVFPADDGAPPGPPPGYEQGNAPVPTDTKKNPYDDPYSQSTGAGPSVDEDAKLAAKLQAEEDARARSGPGGPNVPAGYGASNSPYPQSNSPYPPNDSPYPQQAGSAYPAELPPRERGAKSGGGFLGKLLGKGKQMAGGQQGGGYGGSPGPGGYGGGYPQQQYYGQQQGYPGQGPPMGYGAQPHYGGYGAPGGYGGYGGGPGYGGAPGGGGFGGGGRKPGGGGMGMLGGAALGAGAGLLGGALIADAVDDHEDHEQQEAYQDGFDDGADYGGGDDF